MKKIIIVIVTIFSILGYVNNSLADKDEEMKVTEEKTKLEESSDNVAPVIKSKEDTALDRVGPKDMDFPLKGEEEIMTGTTNEIPVVEQAQPPVPEEAITEEGDSPTLKEADAITHIESHTEGDILKIILTGNGVITRYEAFLLDDPTMLVIDVFKITKTFPQRIIKINSPYIDHIRIGTHPDKVRLCLDSSRKEFPPYHILRNDNRLEIVVGDNFRDFSLIASSQVKEEGKTKESAIKLEAFHAKKGKLIIKDSCELGTVTGKYAGDWITFDALVVYEPGQESQGVRGLRVHVRQRGLHDLPERWNTSFLDLEEIQSLSEAIEYMIDLSAKWKGTSKEYTEVIFSTKGGFNIGFYQQGVELTAFSSSGHTDKPKCVFSSIQDLSSVKVIVDKGLKLLREKFNYQRDLLITTEPPKTLLRQKQSSK